MKTEPLLTRPQRRLLAMLHGNGGQGIVHSGSPRLMIIGEPGDRHARAPTACITGLARRGYVLLGNGGRLELTDDGRTVIAQLGLHGGRPMTREQSVLAHSAACVMRARNALDGIGGDSPWLPLEIPPELRDRLDRLNQETAQIWRDLRTLSQGQPLAREQSLNQKRAA